MHSTNGKRALFQSKPLLPRELPVLLVLSSGCPGWTRPRPASGTARTGLYICLPALVRGQRTRPLPFPLVPVHLLFFLPLPPFTYFFRQLFCIYPPPPSTQLVCNHTYFFLLVHHYLAGEVFRIFDSASFLYTIQPFSRDAAQLPRRCLWCQWRRFGRIRPSSSSVRSATADWCRPQPDSRPPAP